MSSNLVIIAIIGLCCTLVHGASVTKPEVHSASIEKQILKTMEDFRTEINGGKQIFGFPALDPMDISAFNYSLTNKPIGFRIDIKFDEAILSGLSNYETTSVEFDASSGTLSTKSMFPQVQLKASYEMDGNMFGFFPLIGNGKTAILASNLYMTGKSTIKKNSNSLTNEDLKFTFSESRVKSTFTDNIRKGQFSGVASELLNAMGPQIFDNILKPIMSTAISEQMQAYMNKVLSTAAFTELISTDAESAATSNSTSS